MSTIDPLALQHVQRILLVLSGKGGVGKSSVSVQISLCLLLQGFRVGLLDIDLTGPSIPRMLGLEHKRIYQSSAGWVPVYLFTDHSEANMKVVSIGFLLPHRSDAVAWRGLKKTSMIQQLVSRVAWDALDYLIVDAPPGTGDEQIAITQTLYAMNCIEKTQALIITTPQEVALSDVRKEINFCRKAGLDILGIIENMSGYVCPNCSICTHIFSLGGGEELATSFQLPLLGKIPLDPGFVELIENQSISDTIETDTSASCNLQDTSNWSLPEQYKQCSLYPLFKDIVQKIIGI